jgi:hypothetical protein
MQGNAEERDGKLYFKGTVQTQDQANKIWDAIKTVPSWSQEVVADIKASAPAQAGSGTRAQRRPTRSGRGYLEQIAKEFLGTRTRIARFRGANRDQLSDRQDQAGRWY